MTVAPQQLLPLVYAPLIIYLQLLHLLKSRYLLGIAFKIINLY